MWPTFSKSALDDASKPLNFSCKIYQEFWNISDSFLGKPYLTSVACFYLPKGEKNLNHTGSL